MARCAVPVFVLLAALGVGGCASCSIYAPTPAWCDHEAGAGCPCTPHGSCGTAGYAGYVCLAQLGVPDGVWEPASFCVPELPDGGRDGGALDASDANAMDADGARDALSTLDAVAPTMD